jgi:hypothetical protein
MPWYPAATENFAGTPIRRRRLSSMHKRFPMMRDVRKEK